MGEKCQLSVHTGNIAESKTAQLWKQLEGCSLQRGDPGTKRGRKRRRRAREESIGERIICNVAHKSERGKEKETQTSTCTCT